MVVGLKKCVSDSSTPPVKLSIVRPRETAFKAPAAEFSKCSVGQVEADVAAVLLAEGVIQAGREDGLGRVEGELPARVVETTERCAGSGPRWSSALPLSPAASGANGVAVEEIKQRVLRRR